MAAKRPNAPSRPIFAVSIAEPFSRTVSNERTLPSGKYACSRRPPASQTIAPSWYGAGRRCGSIRLRASGSKAPSNWLLRTASSLCGRNIPNFSDQCRRPPKSCNREQYAFFLLALWRKPPTGHEIVCMTEGWWPQRAVLPAASHHCCGGPCAGGTQPVTSPISELSPEPLGATARCDRAADGHR
jgi:hypothetical protein